jgi:D-amino-acid dehydrogenase
MHITVVGAGIIGVCAAYYLREAGHEVTVIERRPGPAQETSFGNAGLIAPGYVTPWAAPGMPGKILSYLFQSEAPVTFRPTLDPAMWRWIARWLRECQLERYRVNKLRMQRLAFYSRNCIHDLRERHALEYEQSQGYLQLFRSERDVDMSAPGRALLKENDVPHRLLDAAGCRAIEPGIAHDAPLAGGLHLPEDESGNCAQFARLLRQLSESMGVQYCFDTQVRRLMPDKRGVTLALQHNAQASTLHCDRVVIAAGPDSGRLLAPLGLRVPLYPVKGYSASVSLNDELQAPRAALMDESYKVAITRFGNRIRIAGTAELGSRALDLRPGATNTLIKVARDWFPVAGHYAQATLWVGARPHAAGRSAADRADPCAGRLARSRSWIDGLGHVLRLRQVDRRHAVRTRARHRHRRPDPGPL